jgi:hypothetical protein
MRKWKRKDKPGIHDVGRRKRREPKGMSHPTRH